MNNKVFVLLEIHHDSDMGSSNVDFDHSVDIFRTEEEALRARERARERVKKLPLADSNEIEWDEADMVVFASDDWWKWKIIPVTVDANHSLKTFKVTHFIKVKKDYEIEAKTKQEAMDKLRAKIQSGDVCAWTEYVPTGEDLIGIKLD